MVSFAHLITGSNDVAEDLVQDSFVGVYRNWDRAVGPAPTAEDRLSPLPELAPEPAVGTRAPPGPAPKGPTPRQHVTWPIA